MHTCESHIIECLNGRIYALNYTIINLSNQRMGRPKVLLMGKFVDRKNLGPIRWCKQS
jgi:hypothetical protein